MAALGITALAREAAAEVGLELPSAIATATTPAATQARALLQVTAEEIIDKVDLQALTVEATFTSVATEEQISDIYSTWTDLARILPETMMDRTAVRRVIGAVNNQQWAAQKAAIANPADFYWRLRGNALQFLGTPSADHTIAFDYMSTDWLKSSDGLSTYDRIQADSNIPRIPGALLKLGFQWRLLHAKGYEYAEKFRAYEARLMRLKARDKPKQTLSLASRPEPLGGPYIPDSSWDIE